MDLIGIEPMTSSMPWKRAPSCATGPQRDQHPLFCWSMPNTSNAPHVATVVSPLSSGERMFNSPRSAKFAVLTLLLWSGSFTGAPLRPPKLPPLPLVRRLRLLQQGLPWPTFALRWPTCRLPSATSTLATGKCLRAARSATQQDVASMQRDLTTTLPGLFTQAEASGPAVLSPSFAVFRNLDALYDVLLRVTETAALAGSEADAANLEDARAGLEDGRGKLGAWLLQSIGAQDAQIARLQASATHPAVRPRRPPKSWSTMARRIPPSRTRRNRPPPRHHSNLFAAGICCLGGV